MKKFAYMALGSRVGSERKTVEFDGGSKIEICRVRDLNYAREMLLQLMNDDFGAIELCGAFNREFILEMIELTQNKVCLGYSVHEPVQDELFERFFSNK